MKNLMKKIFVLALLLIQIVPATKVLAETGTNTNTTGTITIDNAIVGKTYSIYQILKLESYDTEAKAYRYTVTSDGWATFINQDTIKNVYVTIDEFGYVTWKESADVAAFAKLAIDYAKDATNEISPSKDPITATSEIVKFEGLNLGYYLVDSSTGALCGLDTTDKSVVIKEKNTEPTVDKLVEEKGVYGEKNDAKIGDVVNFKTTITVGAGAQKYKLYDKLSTGLTLINNTEEHPITVKVGETTLTNGIEYTLTTNVANGTFEIEFKDTYLKTLSKDTKIVVTYSAILNENAVIEGEGNQNETYLTYGDNHETVHDFTRTYAYSFKLTKVNSDGEQIDGAEFRLYTDAECTNEIKLVKDATTGFYRVDIDATEGTVIAVGTAKIIGLDDATYYLKETKQPEGYNILTTAVTVNINGTTLTDNKIVDITDNYTVLEVSVENKTGAELPSTGGIGTVLFVTFGSLMALCFGVLLVTKLRMSKMNIQA